MEHQIAAIAGAGLAIIIVAAAVSRRTGVATPLLLVGLGIIASYLPGTPVLHVEPEWILAGVLPPLLYASAVNLPVIDVRRNLGLIVWLSVVMVIVSALVIGVVVHWLSRAFPCRWRWLSARWSARRMRWLPRRSDVGSAYRPA